MASPPKIGFIKGPPKATALENDRNRLMGQMDNIRAFLNERPDYADPNLMNKYVDIMNQLVEDFIASDQRMEETLDTIEKITNTLKQIDESRANQLTMEAARQQAAKTLEELREGDKISAQDHDWLLEQLGMKEKEKITVKPRITVGP